MFNLFKRSTSSGMPAEGRFEATISGDVDLVLRGEAVFGVSRDPGDGRAGDRDLFCLVLKDESREGDGDHTITITSRIPEAPWEGRYSFEGTGTETFTAGYDHTADGEGGGTYFAERGKFRITQSRPAVLAGSFDFSARGFNNANPSAIEGSIHIAGTFSAVCVPDASARTTRR